MAAAAELLLRLLALLEGLDTLVAEWGGDAFMAHLPDLRQASTALKQQETADLAGRVAGLPGQDNARVDALAGALAPMHYETAEADLHERLRLEAALVACLRRDGLTGWVHGPTTLATAPSAS